MLRSFPRAGWRSYIATALLITLLDGALHLLGELAGLAPETNVRNRPAFLLASIFIAPPVETAIFLSLPAFIVSKLSRDPHFKYACLYLIVLIFAVAHLQDGGAVALAALTGGAAIAAVYIQADRLRGRSLSQHSPFVAASYTHGLMNLFAALSYFLFPQAA